MENKLYEEAVIETIKEDLAPYVIVCDIFDGKGEKGESIEIYFEVRLEGGDYLKLPLSALPGLDTIKQQINNFLQCKWEEEQKKQTPSEQTVITWKPLQEDK